MQHIMREDARRRFVIGYTIEDSSMRLWFCNRSDILVTEPFDFITVSLNAQLTVDVFTWFCIGSCVSGSLLHVADVREGGGAWF